MNARYYDPETGRFISQDTYRGEGEVFWNLYMYCDGDPVNRNDPTGHIAKKARKIVVIAKKKVTKKVTYYDKEVKTDIGYPWTKIRIYANLKLYLDSNRIWRIKRVSSVSSKLVGVTIGLTFSVGWRVTTG